MQSVKTWMLAAFVLQNAVSQPIRIGDFTRQLTSQDVTTLEQLATAGGVKGSPWLFEGPLGQIGNSIRMYFPAESQTAQLRRGRAIEVWRSSGEIAWTPRQTVQYAQVVEAGRDFNSFSGDMDIHRPFPVSGTFSDEEIISLVTFIRTSPDRVQGSWPIFSLRGNASSAFVSLVGTFTPGPLQEVTLVRQGSTWRVTEVRNRDA